MVPTRGFPATCVWLKLRLVATAVHPRKPFFCRGQPWPAAAQAKTTPNQAPRAACPCGATEPSRHRWWWTGWPCWGAAPGTLLGSPFPSWKRCAQRAPLPPFTLFRTGCFLAGHSRTSVPVTRWAGPKGNNLPKFNKFNAACIVSAQQVTVSPGDVWTLLLQRALWGPHARPANRLGERQGWRLLCWWASPSCGGPLGPLRVGGAGRRHGGAAQCQRLPRAVRCGRLAPLLRGPCPAVAFVHPWFGERAPLPLRRGTTPTPAPPRTFKPEVPHEFTERTFFF